MGGDSEEDYFALPPPALEDRLCHPAEVGQLKRMKRSMGYFRLFGKAAVALGVYLLWGRDFLSFCFNSRPLGAV